MTCLTRRRLLRTIAGLTATSLSLAACGRAQLPSESTSSTSVTKTQTASKVAAIVTTTAPAQPTPTTAPLTTPQTVAGEFLSYWPAQKFDQMYGLISSEAQSSTAKDAFIRRYNAIWDEVGIVDLQVKLQPNQDANSVNQQFHVQMNTALVGLYEEDNTISLIQEGSQWRVQWLPSLIFKELTGDNLTHMFPLAEPRGDILDSKGQKFATAVSYTSVGLVPEQMKDVPSALQAVSKALSYPLARLEALYNKAHAHPTWLQPVQVVPPVGVERVKQVLASVDGVVLTDVSLRGYPQNEGAAQTIGYLGEIDAEELKTLWKQGYLSGDWIGRAGLERWGESYLSGKRGGKLAVVTPQGDVVTTIAERAPQKGNNIVLTLDAELQKAAQEALGKLNGSVVVIRVSDGSLLAFASSPSFDPNRFILGLTQQQADSIFKNPDQPLLNRPSLGAYPPGSTFKTVTISAALLSGVFNQQTIFDCTGVWNVLGIPMHCWKITGHGHIGLYEGLAQSCDIVFYNVGHGLDVHNGHDYFPSVVKQFGVGQLTGIVGVAEAPGLLPSPVWKEHTLHEPWYPGDPVNLAIGQGSLLVTPLQMATWISAIANGGTMWMPRIVDKVVLSTGEVAQPAPVKARWKLPVSDNDLAFVRAAMRRTVSETASWLGTGAWAFRDFPIPVSAKTGTAQSGQQQPHAWFASFAPSDKPEIAVIAMAEHAGEGADVAAPICRRMYEAYFHVNWESLVLPGHHRECITTEYLCPVSWPRVQSTIGTDTYIPK
ncbi:MAG: penicillin-binding protein 2 [Chloroflexi bacterium]|nr:penicillin-binding protein 2 [Chloroflexota bacterium]